MPPAEIPHRIYEVLLKKLSRFDFVAHRDQDVPQNCLDMRLPVLPLIIETAVDSLPETYRARLAGDVDLLCAGKLTLLNQQWPVDAMRDWSLDPDTEERWRWQEYTFDIPRRHGQGPGDAKFVWEISRLQHLQILAIGARLLDREDARERCLSDLQSWLDENPPYRGLGYASGIELASRVISILVIISFLGADTIKNPLKSELWRSLYAHARWIARFPSLHSSANNHLVAESAALFVLGSQAPHLPGADRWKSIGWSRMVDSTSQLILSDGVGAEQSPTYLAYTIEWLLLSRMVGVSNSGNQETELDTGLLAGARFIASVADARGNIPAIGDCDESVVLRMGLEERNYAGSVVMAIARCLQAGDMIHPAFDDGFRGGLLSDDELPPSTYVFRNAVFSEGGYSVLRTDDHGSEIFLLFDHGPLGFAHTAAHGHADALSVWLHVDGKPVLVDFGTYRYGADKDWRRWARSTAAHNTVELDGRSQSDMSGPFNWGRRARGSLLRSELDGSKLACVASHDGYVDTVNVVHERRVEIDCRVVLISDRLSGSGSHLVKVSYHFAPEVTVKCAGPAEFEVFSEREPVGRISFDCPGMACDLVRQESVVKPGPGMISPAYNLLQPAWSIVLSGQARLPYACQAVLTVA